MSILCINDLHLGAQRQAGTTPKSQVELRDGLQGWLRDFLDHAKGEHVVCNGDLFDGFSVDVVEVIRAFNTFAGWLNGGNNRLTLIAGNHDWAPRAEKVSSFHLLCHFLRAQFPLKVEVIDHTNGFTRVTDDTWAIPHMPNQDLFNLEIQRAIDRDQEGDVPEPRFLLLHANCTNYFAEHSDHSLNVNEAQLDELTECGWTVVFAHEHQNRTLRGGRVIVVGNQTPSSISDCLENDVKYYLCIKDGKVWMLRCWLRGDNYVELDWKDLEDVPEVPFIRVVGNATADQAADVVSAVANLRRVSDALVIGNGVKIEGMADFEALSEMSFDDVKKVDVLGMLLEELNEREQKTVRELLS